MAQRTVTAAAFYGTELPRPYLLPSVEYGGSTSLRIHSWGNPTYRENRPVGAQHFLLEWASLAPWQQGGISKNTKSAYKKTFRKLARDDLGKPKRPATAFFLFCEEARPQLAKENAALAASVTEVAKELGRRWKALTAEEKQVFESAAAEKKEEYKKLVAKWKLERGVVASTAAKSKRTKKTKNASGSLKKVSKKKVGKGKAKKKSLKKSLISSIRKAKELRSGRKTPKSAPTTPVTAVAVTIVQTSPPPAPLKKKVNKKQKTRRSPRRSARSMF